MLTARGEESDKVLGLESGADDYLAKPFGIREFVARVRALLRRSRARSRPRRREAGAAPARSVTVHGVEIDPARRRVRVRGQEVELTTQEFKLLHLLASHPGIVFSREALLARVWPGQTFVTPRSRRHAGEARCASASKPIPRSPRSCSPCGAPATRSPMSDAAPRRRRAAGIAASTGASPPASSRSWRLMLLAQGALFLWLSAQRDEAMPPRLLADLAPLVAEELTDAAARAPGADLADLARARFADLGRPAALVLADGRVVCGGIDPPPPIVAATAARGCARLTPTTWRSRASGRGGPRGRGRRGGSATATSARRRGPRRRCRRGRVAPVRVGRARRGGRARGPRPSAGRRWRVNWRRGSRPGSPACCWRARRWRRWRCSGRRRTACAISKTRPGASAPAIARARASEAGGDEVASVARAFNRMAREAAAREAALVDADRARRQLLADVTHELRTPLTAIRGYAETLTLPAFAPASPQGRQAVHVVDVEAQRLERLVNDLLDLARFDAGGAPLELAAVPVRAAVHAGRRTPRAGRRGRRPDARDRRWRRLPSIVRGDERRLEQVLQNLTANALRHTPPGGRVCARRHARRRTRWSSPCATPASGIAAEHLPYVFDRFYKADTARSDAARHRAWPVDRRRRSSNATAARVRVTSTPGVETCFEVRLPG